MTYKVTKFVFDIPNKEGISLRKYITVDSDMDWDTEKSLRGAIKGSFIVRQV